MHFGFFLAPVSGHYYRPEAVGPFLWSRRNAWTAMFQDRVSPWAIRINVEPIPTMSSESTRKKKATD